jgi:hypothetical protein
VSRDALGIAHEYGASIFRTSALPTLPTRWSATSPVVRRQNRMLSFDQQFGACLQRAKAHVTAFYKLEFVPESVLSVLAAIRVFFRSRGDTALEILALRQPGRSPQTEAAAAASKLSGSAVLDYSAAVLVSLGRSPRYRQVQDRRRLASRGLPLVLALAFPAARRSAKDHRGDSTAHPSDGTAECRLGCPKDPRRTAKARFRAVRTDRGSLPAAHSSSA